MFSEEINRELAALSKSNNYRGIMGLLKDYTEIAVAIAISIHFDNVLAYIVAIILNSAVESVLKRRKKVLSQGLICSM